jgi:hypothetical protein
MALRQPNAEVRAHESAPARFEYSLRHASVWLRTACLRTLIAVRSSSRGEAAR